MAPAADAGHRTGPPGLTEQDWESLAERRIFFGHQSVGRDILAGVQRLVTAREGSRPALVESPEPARVRGPALVTARIGRNRDPESKTRAFEAALAGGFGDEDGAIAMYKYCYVDLMDGDPAALFAGYAAGVERVRERHPGLTLVHVTLPLHRAPHGLVERVRSRFGSATETARNARRCRYNELLRQAFAGEPIFDLARLESTRADGSTASSRLRGRSIDMLAPEWTEDGGHLVPAAQDRLAEQLLVLLARCPRRSARGIPAGAGPAHH